MHEAWKNGLRVVSEKLLNRIGSTRQVPTLHAEAAFLILPGLIRLLNELKSPCPVDFIRSCSGIEDAQLSASILHKAKEIQVMKEKRRAIMASRRKNGAKPKHKLSSKKGRKQLMRRMEKLSAVGRLSTSTKMVDQAHKAIVHGDGEARSADFGLTAVEIQEVIAALYPAGRAEDDLEAVDTPSTQPKLVEAIDFDADIVREVIKRLPKGSAHGSSPWTYSWIQKLFGGTDNALARYHSAIGSFFRKMKEGKLDMNLWTCSRAVLIPKAEEGKWRPIGIGESWYRMFGRAVLFELGRDEFADKFTPLQFGVCVQGGCEYVARMAQLSLDHRPGHVLLKTDFKNAFNLIPRQLILKGLREMCPALIPFFKWAYGKPSKLINSQGVTVGESATGCKQGDPLSALFFCAAIHPTLKDIDSMLVDEYYLGDPNKREDLFYEVDDDKRLEDLGPRPLCMAYMDDMNLSVPWQLALPVSANLKGLFKEVGLELNDDKCRIVGPNGRKIQQRCEDEGRIAPYQFEFSGSVVLGNPVGEAAYRREKVMEMCKEATASLKTLTGIHLSSCTVFNLIKFCYNPRASFLARVQDPEVFIDGLLYFDGEIDAAIARTAGHDLGGDLETLEFVRKRARLATIRSLPTEWGGLGVGRHSWVSGDVACHKSRNMTCETRGKELQHAAPPGRRA